MEEAPVPIITPKFINEKNYKVKLNDIEYNLLIRSDNESINFLLSPLIIKNLYSYEEIYNCEKLSKINKIFLAFDSIETIRQSIEQMIENNKYSIKEKNENVEINLKVSLFEKLIDINLILIKKNMNQNQINKNIFEQLNELNDKIEKLMQVNNDLTKKMEMLKEENKQIKNLNNKIELLMEENKKIKNLNDEIEILKEENKKIKNLNDEIEILKEENKKIKKSNEDLLNLFYEFKNSYKNELKGENYKFKFKNGKNYAINKNGLVATKIDGGNSWNCSVIGDKEIPKNKISKWKIKINNIAKYGYNSDNSWNLLIGIGPDNINEERNFQRKCWSFICGESKIKNKNNEKDYIEKIKIKNNDIIGVIVDRQKGNLSFEVNGINYGIACSDIPKEDKLYPVINICDNNQSVEILN